MKLPLGFEFKEEMSGTWTPPDGGAERSIRFSLRASADDLARYLRDHTVTLRGTLEAEGLAGHAPAEGTMMIAPLTQGVIRYELAFTGDDGHPYRLQGQKNVKLTDFANTMTTLPASILKVEAGAEVGRAVLRFNLRDDLLSFLRSWKPVVAS
jgi:hypothetical protein